MGGPLSVLKICVLPLKEEWCSSEGDEWGDEGDRGDSGDEVDGGDGG